MATSEQPLTRREFYEAVMPNLATKADLSGFKADVQKDLAELERRLTGKIDGQLRWMVGLQLLGLGAVAAIMRFLA